MDDVTKKDTENIESLEFSSESMKHLDEARKWSMFLAILGFIMVGFMVLAAIILGSVFSFIGGNDLSPLLGVGIAILYLAVAVLYFFPVYYLFNFSNKTKEAVRSSDSRLLTESMRFLKAHYRFLGIMVIVMLALYPIIILLIVLGGVFSGF